MTTASAPPFIGQTVLFHPYPGRLASGETPLAAIVTGIAEKGYHLIVFPPGASPFNEDGVLSKDEQEARGNAGRFWQFPNLAGA